MIRAPASLVLAAFVALAAVVACSSLPEPAACGEIPTSGCPAVSGEDVCMDPTCAAAYACTSGKWVLSARCPARPGDGGVDSAPDVAESSFVFDADIDVPPGAGGGPGCLDLESPDCSLETALLCEQAGSGCCGCVDLWVCDQGGWTLWGACGDGGLLPAP